MGRFQGATLDAPRLGTAVLGCRETKPSRRDTAYFNVSVREVFAGAAVMAFLCLAQVWFCFLATGSAVLFYYEGPATAKQFAALLADTVLLTAFFVLVWRCGNKVRSVRRKAFLQDTLFLLFLVVPANAIRGVLAPATAKLNLQYWRHVGVGFPITLQVIGFGGLLLLVAGALLRYSRRLVGTTCKILVFLFPAIPFLVAEASWIVMHRPGIESRQSRPVDPAPGHHSGPRVVWLLFDEMDYRLAFETATNARLPEFNRLARESLFAESAYPPGGRTIVSVPALLSGRLVISSIAKDSSTLLVQYEGAGSPVRWGAEQTILDRGEENKSRTGVTGWYFPYGRIFGDEMEVRQVQGWRLGLNPNQPFMSLMSDEFRVLGRRKEPSPHRSIAEHRRSQAHRPRNRH